MIFDFLIFELEQSTFSFSTFKSRIAHRSSIIDYLLSMMGFIHFTYVIIYNNALVR